MEYKVHPVDWTDEKVKRFWDFYNNNRAFEDLWFSKAVGQSIIGFVNRYSPIKGNILDYGIGKGHFSGYLLEDSAIQVYACDFSEETVTNINNQFTGKQNFKGCYLVKGFPSEFREQQFDFVFLIEAIEHLTDNYLDTTIAEAKRILKPGGTLVITTPNDENLPLYNVICPDCGCVYHRVQHVRKFDANTLNTLVAGYDFATVFCGATEFIENGKDKLMHKLKRKLRPLFNKTYKQPHLIYIGKKL